MGETYYDLLDVPRDASTADVEASYRERAKETHPDLSDAPDAVARFAAVSRARDVLTDPAERARYDRLGHEAYVSGVRAASGRGSDGSEESDTPEQGAASPEASRRRRRRGERARRDAADAGRGRRGGPRRGFDGGAFTAGGVAEPGGRGSPGADGPFERRHASRNRSRSWYRPGAGGTDGYAVSTGDGRGGFASERVVLAAATVALYPLLVAVAFLPGVPLAANVVVGLCTFALVIYLLSVPEAGVLVFGGWTVLAPVGLGLAGVGLLSPLGILAWSFCWIPFVLAGANLLLRRA